MPSLPSTADVKSYLGLTGSGDDTLIASRLAAAIAMAEHDTGRTFSAASNTTTRYSTNNESSLVVHDRPLSDPSRVVTWNGVTLTENISDPKSATVWFLPDRRDPNITTVVQIRLYATQGQWYKADPMWFDRNLDKRWYGAGFPLDLAITGIIGHPFPVQDVDSTIIVAAAYLYWRAKAGATGTAYTINADPISLSEMPPEYQAFVARWKIRTAVDSVG